MFTVNSTSFYNRFSHTDNKNLKTKFMKNIAHNNQAAKIVLIVSFLILLYWNFAHNIDVYKYGVVGALYEMTSLLVVAATFILPLIILIVAFINKFRINNKYYIALCLLGLTIILLLTIYN